jgi:S-adenosylhomocysteine hydrolase
MTSKPADAARSKVADPGLAARGRSKIDWAESRMPVLMALREEHSRLQSLKGMRIAGCLHVTKETAVLIETLSAAGAEISWSGCNPLSTQDDVAAALAAAGVSIYAWHGMNVEEFYWCIDRTLDWPTLTLDDGADLIFSVHNRHPHLIAGTSAAPRRPPPACSACAPWRPTASSCTRSSRSTTARPSGTSTTSTAPARARSTASCAPRR